MTAPFASRHQHGVTRTLTEFCLEVGFDSSDSKATIEPPKEYRKTKICFLDLATENQWQNTDILLRHQHPDQATHEGVILSDLRIENQTYSKPLEFDAPINRELEIFIARIKDGYTLKPVLTSKRKLIVENHMKDPVITINLAAAYENRLITPALTFTTKVKRRDQRFTIV